MGTVTDMKHLADRSRQVRQKQTEIRQALRSRQINLAAVMARAIFEPDIGSMPIRRVVSALPRMSAHRTAEIMANANIPTTRRLSWLIRHPEATQRLQGQIDAILSPRRKQIPNPNWPWFGGVDG